VRARLSGRAEMRHLEFGLWNLEFGIYAVSAVLCCARAADLLGRVVFLLRCRTALLLAFGRVHPGCPGLPVDLWFLLEQRGTMAGHDLIECHASGYVAYLHNSFFTTPQACYRQISRTHKHLFRKIKGPDKSGPSLWSVVRLERHDVNRPEPFRTLVNIKAD